MSTTLTGEPSGSPRPGEVELRLLAEGLRVSMIHLSRQLRRHDPSELSITQVSGLASVVSHGPLGVGRLAELENLPSSAATRLADRLEATGLVVRQANPGDRRGVQVVATPAGAALLADYARAGNEWLAERLAALSEADLRVLERAVAVLRALAAGRPAAVAPAPAEAPTAQAGRA
ncbi:MAG: MarR family winged helix-turn-helix transcriptional regulator [Candidatus Dormibacteria bacterium]